MIYLRERRMCKDFVLFAYSFFIVFSFFFSKIRAHKMFMEYPMDSGKNNHASLNMCT